MDQGTGCSYRPQLLREMLSKKRFDIFQKPEERCCIDTKFIVHLVASGKYHF